MITKMRGTMDILPEEIPAFRYIEETARRVAARYGFSEIRIDITKNYEEVEAQINDAVNFINSQIDAVGLDNGWELFDPDPKAYYQNKKAIRISDNIVFKTNNDVCNIVLGKNYNGNQKQRVSLSNGVYAWLPTKMDVNKPNEKEYANEISQDGTKIYERTTNPNEVAKRMSQQLHIGQERVVFAKIKDPVTEIEGYRFIGVFKGRRYEADGTLIYERIAEDFDII